MLGSRSCCTGSLLLFSGHLGEHRLPALWLWYWGVGYTETRPSRLSATKFLVLIKPFLFPASVILLCISTLLCSTKPSILEVSKAVRPVAFTLLCLRAHAGWVAPIFLMKSGNRNQGEDKGNELRDSSQPVFHVISRKNWATYVCTTWLSSPNITPLREAQNTCPTCIGCREADEVKCLGSDRPHQEWLWCLLQPPTGTQLSSWVNIPFI